MSAERRAGFIVIIIAAAGYAFLPTFTRLIYSMSALKPTDIAIWRFLFATPIIWLVILLREQWQPHTRSKTSLPLLRLMPLGILCALAALSAFIGLQYIPASLFIVLFYTYPAMVALLSVLMGQRLSMIAWMALGLTLVGVTLTVPDLAGLEQGSVFGIFVALGNAVIVAVYFFIVGRVMKGVSSLARATAWVITSTFLVLLFTIPFYGLTVPPNLNTWLVLFALAAISTAMPIFLMNIGIQMVGATQASIISTAEPVLSMMLAVLLLGERLLPVQWVGAALIVIAVVVLEARPGRKQTTVNAPG